jgi:hypothetical protein
MMAFALSGDIAGFGRHVVHNYLSVMFPGNETLRKLASAL